MVICLFFLILALLFFLGWFSWPSFLAGIILMLVVSNVTWFPFWWAPLLVGGGLGLLVYSLFVLALVLLSSVCLALVCSFLALVFFWFLLCFFPSDFLELVYDSVEIVYICSVSGRASISAAVVGFGVFIPVVSYLIMVVPVLCVILCVASVVSPSWCSRCGLSSVVSSVLLFSVSSFQCFRSLSVQWSISCYLWCPWGNIYGVVRVKELALVASVAFVHLVISACCVECHAVGVCLGYLVRLACLGLFVDDSIYLFPSSLSVLWLASYI